VIPTLQELASKLRPEQRDAARAICEHLRDAKARGFRGPQATLCAVSPTGTGKSFIEGAAHRCANEALDLRTYTTFPQIEIARAVYEKVYQPLPEDASETHVRTALEAVGMWTIKRLHNALLKGEVPLPDALLHDETHHATDDTHETVWAVAGLPPLVGLTATDYRGTVAETQKFRAKFPKLYRVLTLKKAIELGRLALPSFDVWPLVNDEEIEVKNGEFSTSAVDSATEDVLPDLIERLRSYLVQDPDSYEGYAWDEPTTVVCNSVASVNRVVDALDAAGLPALPVVGDTPPNERRRAFRMTLAREVVLVQVRVVGEGVDLPLRRMIDLAPTMSPVLWMQRVGRITRPWEQQPSYICCNHNLARHAYLWHGCVPPSAIKKAFEAWGKEFKPSRRFLARAIDVEGLGRFQPGAVPFKDGGVASLYCMQSKDGGVQYAVLLHPLRPEPWFFGREIPLTGRTVKQVVETPNGPIEVEMKERDYNSKAARWRKLPALPDVKGMISIKPGRLTPGQLDWWKRSAEHFGLDAGAEVTNREFQLLPILANSGARLNVED